MPKKRTPFWGVIGIILFIAGAIGTIPLALERNFPGLLITSALLIAGILIFAWVFSD